MFYLLVLLIVPISAQDLLCDKYFCDDYVHKNNCPDLPDRCKILNSTHNGLFLPHLGPCNCCEFCLNKLNEGETCAIGDPTVNIPDSICGDGLTCVVSDSASKKQTCQKIFKSKCTQKQMEYDEMRKSGTLGHMQLRPNCDRNGKFEPYNCIPGEICYCVDEDGNRIFGEIPYTPQANLLMKCQCSRAYNKMQKVFGRALQRNEMLRCQSNGDYDRIQCINEKCLCVDAVDGAPTYPTRALVNMTLVSNSSLPCFDAKKHEEYQYYRNCESEFMDKHKEIEEFKKNNWQVYGTVYPRCQLDGFYAGVQETLTEKYCADLNGKDITERIDKTLSAAKDMDCKCARAKLLIDGIEKPTCLPNGNYEKCQCRRGLCRCVDVDGNQMKKEVLYSDKQDCCDDNAN